MELDEIAARLEVETISGAQEADGAAFRAVFLLVDSPSEVPGCRDLVRVSVRIRDRDDQSLADAEAAAWRRAAQVLRDVAEKIDGSA